MKFTYLGHGGGLCNGEKEENMSPFFPAVRCRPPNQIPLAQSLSTVSQSMDFRPSWRDEMERLFPQLALVSVMSFRSRVPVRAPRASERARLSLKAVALSVLNVILVAKILSHWPVGELLGGREGGWKELSLLLHF